MRTSLRCFSLVLLGIVFSSVVACQGFSGEKAVLHVYTWSDYFDPDVIADFEDSNNCRVAIDYFDSNEAMYAKLKAGAGGYDVITPSSYMSAVMDKQGLIQNFDHAKLPNMQHLDMSLAPLTEDPDFAYSIPYTRTVTGIGYNKARLGELPHTWNVFSDQNILKRATMLNDMRESIGAALKCLGYSINSTTDTELAEAGKLLTEWKKNLAKFEVDEAKIGLGSGEFFLIHVYNGDAALIMQENDGIDFFVPEEGASMTTDDFVILAESKQPDLAHAFVNYFLDPEVAALNMEGIRYYMPNPEAVEQLPDDLKDSPAFNINAELLRKCEVIRDLGANNAKYSRIWDMVKASD